MGAAVSLILGAAGLYMSYSSSQSSAGALKNQAWYESLIGGLEKELYYSNANLSEQMAGLAKGKAAILQKTAEINSMSAETEAVSIQTNTLDMVTKVRKAGSQIMGSQTARYLKAGVELEGSPMLVMQETAKSIETDVANILASGKIEERKALNKAFAFTMEGEMAGLEGGMSASSLLGQARLQRIYGQQSSIGSAFRQAGYGYQENAAQYQGYGTLLTGASNVAFQYGSGRKAVSLV